MLAERLIKLRKQKKRTQQDMADYLGITRPAYTAYERGTRQPDYDTLEKLADYFEVSTDYLLGRTNIPNIIPDNLPPLTEKDEKDIAKRMAKIKEDLKKADGLNFAGEPMSEEAIESLLEAIEYAERTTVRVNKKYTPKKYRKDNE
ncbi:MULTISPECIES: helix-turn-helix transcriptional regulator [Bacillus]|uniref:helix-turn-helix domain-containing protein n=1 Tax=Bacillus TaxID=1386 RepID=UPI002E23747A|nr:helix-turn-helix transcriptional regulator [Bacillus smithii]MED4928161.1 helix-turn-helix transcriptional regulator [Bacillus smithii]